MTVRFRKAVVAVLLMALALVVVAAQPAGAAETRSVSSGSADSATIYVVQGLPAKTIDVAIDGDRMAADVATAKVVGPFEVGAGTHTVTFTDAAGKVVATNTVSTAAGSNSDVVVHLQTAASAEPMVTQFANAVSAIPADKAAVTVAHTAAVPPADIRVDGKVLFANVANGESLDVVVPAGTYRVDIVQAGETAPPVFGPVDLAVKGGTLTKVYAVGDPAAKTMNVAVHEITLPRNGSAPPTLIDTGTGGSAVLLQIFALLTRLWQG